MNKNKNYLCIDFKSSLEPHQMLARLRQKFPEQKWVGSDTEMQGPSLSSLAKDKPGLQIFFEDGNNTLGISFSGLGLDGSELEDYKSRFATYIREEVLPLITA